MKANKSLIGTLAVVAWLCTFGVTSVAAAGPGDDLAYNAQLRGDVAKLFASGKPQDATAYLSSNVRKTQGSDNRIEIVQQLVVLSLEFYNKKQQPLAAQAAQEATKSVKPLLNDKSPDPYRASALLNLGMVYELVLRDPDTAQDLYSAAVDAQPGNEQAKQMLARIKAKPSHQ